WVAFASPLVAAGCCALAGLAWRTGLRSYSSAVSDAGGPADAGSAGPGGADGSAVRGADVSADEAGGGSSGVPAPPPGKESV
ncbi:hypothetical protein ACWDLL_23620, partial [Streptomyces griseoincarnatus]